MSSSGKTPLTSPSTNLQQQAQEQGNEPQQQPGQPQPPPLPLPPQKRRAHRVSRACDFCHSRSIRCRPNESGGGACQSCLEYDRECTYYRPSKKRGVKSISQQRTSLPESSRSSSTITALDPDRSFQPPDFLPLNSIVALVELFFESIYPVFPIFHRQTLLRRIHSQEYLREPLCYANVASLCAVTISRLRDGLLLSHSWTAQDIQELPYSDVLEDMADAVIPEGARVAGNLDYLRAVCLMALNAFQHGQREKVQVGLGTYHICIRIGRLADEKYWPPDISVVETEERRRLCWSMYIVEILSAACFDTVISYREAQIRVGYPRQLADESWDSAVTADPGEVVAESGQTSRPEGLFGSDWIQGWNFCTDLYRVLEHTINWRRDEENAPYTSIAANILSPGTSPSGYATIDMIFRQVLEKYSSLPEHFKKFDYAVGGLEANRFGFLATCIIATIQLVRLALFFFEESSTQQQCQIIDDVVQALSELPIRFLRLINTRLLFHLDHISIRLSQHPDYSLSINVFNKRRETLIRLADLIGKLAEGTRIGDEPLNRIKSQIVRMEQYLQAQHD